MSHSFRRPSHPSGAIKESNGTSAQSGPPSGFYTLTIPDGWSGYLVASFKPGPSYLVNVPAYYPITGATGTLTRDFIIQMGPGFSPETLSGTVLKNGSGMANVLVIVTSGTGGGSITGADGSYAIGLQTSGSPPNYSWTGVVTPITQTDTHAIICKKQSFLRPIFRPRWVIFKNRSSGLKNSTPCTPKRFVAENAAWFRARRLSIMSLAGRLTTAIASSKCPSRCFSRFCKSRPPFAGSRCWLTA